MAKIKICGMMREEDILAANIAKPDYVGFIFVDWERHYISPETAKHFKSLLDPSIQSVGCFIDEPIESVISLLNDNIIDVAQLHGHEDDAYILELKKRTGKTIVKSCGVTSTEDIQSVMSSTADFILLDTPGGCTGNSFDWSLIQNVNRPFFLAGGLNCDNIATAIEQLHPYAVDLSSGAETNKLKDPEKMKQLVNIVRSIN